VQPFADTLHNTARGFSFWLFKYPRHTSSQTAPQMADQLLEQIREVAEGQIVITPTITSTLASNAVELGLPRPKACGITCHSSFNHDRRERKPFQTSSC